MVKSNRETTQRKKEKLYIYSCVHELWNMKLLITRK